MAQGLIAGATNYDEQSILDIKSDIENWISYSFKIRNFFETTIEELKIQDYWDSKVPYNFQTFCIGVPKICETFCSDFEIILDSIKNDRITQREINLMKKIYKVSKENEEYSWKSFKDKNDATSGHIVEVVGNTDTETKKGVPTTIKKVKENTKAVNVKDNETDTKIPNMKVGTQYNDVADYDIGDKVPFELIGTLPADYSRYSAYCYKFHDKMDKSFTLDSQSIKAFYSNDNGDKWTELKDFSTTDPDKNTNSFTVTFSDLKKISKISATSKIKVTFDATLNEQANIGLPGNANESYLEFSNDANSLSHGKTAPDKVIVFTYAIDTTKIDAATKDQANPTALKGAQFQIKKGNSYLHQNEKGFITWGSEEGAKTFTSGDDGKFVVKGLDSGTYTFHETKAPDGYNLGDDLTVELTATTANGQSWGGAAEDALTKLTLKENSQDQEKEQDQAKHGTASQTITNDKGSLLPSTGGIGTKLLYAAGGILVACAAAYVVISKKHSAGK